MPNFVLIIGPQAVGKMTVGQELAKLTGYKLLSIIGKFYFPIIEKNYIPQKNCYTIFRGRTKTRTLKCHK